MAGVAHVVGGPDHLTAVAPLAIEGRTKAWLPGLMWGIGHTLGIGAVGYLLLQLNDAGWGASISHWSELLVGVVLMLMGLVGMRNARRFRVHMHPHIHPAAPEPPLAPPVHLHLHMHPVEEPHRGTVPQHSENLNHTHRRNALLVGLLHGSAGGNNLISLLPTLTLGGVEAMAYGLGFVVSSILAMMLFAWLVGLYAEKLRESRAFFRLMFGTGLTAFVIGAGWFVWQLSRF